MSFVFSDKTGTLTSNSMEFVRCSVGGVVYGPPNAKALDEARELYHASLSLPKLTSPGLVLVQQREGVGDC